MRSFLKPVITLAAVTAGSCLAQAQPVGYAKAPVAIKCGVLLLPNPSGGEPTNADPYVFFNLERRTDVKPASWVFVNPHGGSTFTRRQAGRWNTLTGTTNFSSGTRLNKNMAAYWEVELSQVATVADYDILMVHAPGGISLNTAERDKLQAFIDAGGTLWFDKSFTQSVDGFNGFPVPFTTLATGANPQVVQPFHPLLNYPFSLGYFDAAYMGSHNGGHAIVRQTLASIGLGGFGDIVQTMEPDFYRLNPIIANTSGISLGVAELGNGHFVVSSGNISSRINEPAGGTDIGLGRNSGPVAGTNFGAIPMTELKFMYNMIALSGGHPALSKGSRRHNASFDEIGAPLLQTWSDPTLNLDQGDDTNYFPPVVYKGLVFVADGSTLYAYKADPNRDLDNDGWNDDGFQDASGGAKSDLVWRSGRLNGPLSSPICLEVANPARGNPRDQVCVVDGTGSLVVFDALPKDPQGRLLGAVPIAPVGTVNPPSPPVLDLGIPNRGPYTPVAFEGIVYVYDAYRNTGGQINGRVWAVDSTTVAPVQTGGTRWNAAGVGGPNIPDPGGAPTVGYIPIADGGGGLDAVMYVPNRASLTGNAAGITSLWIGAKGESPSVSRVPGSITVVTRAAGKGLSLFMQPQSSLGIRIYLVDDNANGRPLTPAETATYLAGTATQNNPGQLTVDMQGNQTLPANIGVRIDYHIDWGTAAPNLVSQLIRGQLFMPEDINRRRHVVKSMALAPNGNLFVIANNEQHFGAGRDGGTLFCIKEFSRGQFNLVYRWDLYDRIRITLNGTQSIDLEPPIVDMDYLVTNMVPFLNRRLTRLHFHGSPTVIGDVCYITVSGDKEAVGRPRATVLMAFDANPSHTDVRLGVPIPSGFRMRQPDVAASSNKGAPERYVSLQANQAEQQTQNGVIRFENMMQGTGGDMRNAFSTSLPVIVGGAGQPETILDPDATGSKWNPLLWYFVANGYVNGSPALVMGNTVYMAGGNILPDLFAGLPPRERPAMFALDAVIPPNDPSMLTIPGRPGLRQLRWLYPDPSTPIGFKSNPHVRWPSGEGVQSFNDFLIRLNSTLLDGSLDNLALGVVGGDGTIVAWAQNGLFGFKRGTTVVADEGRIIEVDASGFVQWTSDLSYQFAQDVDTTLVQSKKLVRPTKIYKTADSEYLVVDTGGDRIARIDKGAGEVRTIEQLSLDTTYRPDGWNEGSELKLRQPRDVATWSDFVPAANNRLTGPRQLEHWVHYLIADTGNRRMIEVVDRYEADPATFAVGNVVRAANGDPQVGKLIWHTPQELSGKTWQYTAVQRFQVGVDGNNDAQFVYITAVGDMLPTRVNLGLDPPSGTNPRETGGGGGGLVIFDSVTPAGDQVINEIFVNGVRKVLTAINSVSVRPVAYANGIVDYAIMFTDSSGVYEIARAGNQWNVIWMMPNNVYENVRNVKLRAVAAKRLSGSDVLITNAYYGKTNPITGPPNIPARDFFGEVTQWRSDVFNIMLPNFGFSNSSIKFELPPVVGSRGLRSPQFADRL